MPENAIFQLYLSDMTKGESGETVPIGAGVFQTASAEGSRVFFTEGSDLYVFEVTSGRGEPLAGKTTDLTVVKNPGESAGVQGVVPGAAEDGSDVYFVASGVLSSAENGEHEKAVSGAPNLYVEHYNGAPGEGKWEEPAFIATLSSGDSHDWETPFVGDLSWVTSEVSPSGRYLAFMSDRSLTGYDNIDASSGAADEEVFLYDAQSGRLVCASCDPTGARPVGVLGSGAFPTGLLVDGAGEWNGRWLAGSVPGWDPLDTRHALRQPRYLSDSGRLFFNGADALVPADVNGREDVYQYEPGGKGSCRNASRSASEVFSEAAGGCVALISSGTSAEESAFLDASSSGDDVFFLTASRLVPQDSDTALDVYDAHVCSEASPCIAPAASAPPCTTADSCRAAPLPQPSLFGAPPSATFSGAGNLPPPAGKPASKPLTRAQKLAKALKACHKKKNRRKRAACESQTRKSYGAKASGAKKARKTNASRKGRG